LLRDSPLAHRVIVADSFARAKVLASVPLSKTDAICDRNTRRRRNCNRAAIHTPRTIHRVVQRRCRTRNSPPRSAAQGKPSLSA